MAPGSEEALIPKWAADLAVGVAEIKGMTGQIPGIVQELKEVKANQVPLNAHLELRQKVEELVERDLSARTQWNEITAQVPVLWDERAQIKGALRFWRGAVFVLGAAFTMLSLFVLVHNTGATVSFHP